jgi:hypothetical protein
VRMPLCRLRAHREVGGEEACSCRERYVWARAGKVRVTGERGSSRGDQCG